MTDQAPIKGSHDVGAQGTHSPPSGHRPLQASHEGESAGWPQLFNILLGGWLVASTYIWSHGEISRMNTWVLGILIALIAAAALVRPEVHRLNAAVATWLIISTLWLTHITSATAWNNAIVGLLVIGYAVATREDTPIHWPRRWRRI
jgi:hypothetical protein